MQGLAALKKGIVCGIKAADCNTTSDQQFNTNTGGRTWYAARQLASGASTSLTSTSVDGIWTGAGGTGTKAYSGSGIGSINNSTIFIANAASGNPKVALTATSLYFKVSIAQGSAATVNFVGLGFVVPHATNHGPYYTPCPHDGNEGATAAFFYMAFGKTFDFNTTSDQAFKIRIRESYALPKCYNILNSSGTFATCAGGFYTGAGKTGTTLLSAATTYTALTGSTTRVTKNSASTTSVTNGATYYLSLTTAEGSAATADFMLAGPGSV